MKTLIERIQETYRRITPSCESIPCEGIKYFGRPVSEEEIRERREAVYSFDYEL